MYTFLGRYRAHYKPIRALFFGLTPDENQPILITIGKKIDKFMNFSHQITC